jgi:hypothetical protein
LAEGWIKLHRQLQQSDLWNEKPFSRGQAWVDMLLMANHEARNVLFDGRFIPVDRGSFITSEVKLMDKWGWSKSKVRLFLSQLEIQQMIVKKTDTKKTSISICNYCVYQDSETTEKPLKDRRKTTEEPLKDTNKNEKNDKNEKNNIFTPPTLEEVKAYCKERNNKIDAERWYDFYSSKGWMIGKNKMKDWKAAVRTWEKSDTGKLAQQKPVSNFEGRKYDANSLEAQLLARGKRDLG